MSIVNYLGCNSILPASGPESDNEIIVGDFFSDKEMRAEVHKHLSAKYIYEVTSRQHGSIWFNKYYKQSYPKGHEEGQKGFKSLCAFLDQHLASGDYCELYTCWVGDESEEPEYKDCINLHDFDIEKIEVDEKSLLVINK
ncbi:hypothetical protein JGK52_07445 [Cytobacillus oceanisediminis]|uniref:hypothetical protein n=1 Tax=Cytobacillus oceanisediminis TaxID=665099 RepID=UPI001D15638A|nr:hypothetical protein [Cytobacillus oceanisediminis]MCC3646517.1 hypothetical protein [Cytobacillus oceanisediminis]